MLYLVTGGAGFIGSHLVEGLRARGNRVRVLDNLSSGSWANLKAVADDPQVELIEGDVRSPGDIDTAMEGVAAVFHHAAMVSVVASVEHPAASFANNTQGTFNVFEAARRCGVERVIYASSASVYGDNPAVPLKEDEPSHPLSPYALDKSYAEQLAQLYFRLYGIESVGLRYFNVYGPRQDPSSPYSGVVSIFIERARRGESVVINGDGEQTRDFISVKDVVAANLVAVQRVGMGAECFNIGSGEAISINDLADRIGEAVGRPLVRRNGVERPGDIRHSVADATRVRRDLGWSARVPFLDGLTNTFIDG